MNTYDDFYAQLVAANVHPDRAAIVARAKYPDTAPIDGPRDAAALEKAEQRELVKLFTAYGFTVRSTSQARASKVAPGLPDLVLHHTRRPLFAFWESKRQVGGTLSPAQVAFRDDCARCGVECRFGDRYAAAAWLVHVGLAVRVGDRIEPARSFQNADHSSQAVERAAATVPSDPMPGMVAVGGRHRGRKGEEARHPKSRAGDPPSAPPASPSPDGAAR